MSENENNFESLRRLLALKRREIPPPGYFDHFSREVTARIRAEEASRTANVSSQLSWLSRLLSAFEAKPAFAGAFASAMCLLLLFGIVFAQRPDTALQPLLTISDQSGAPIADLSPAAFTAQASPTVLALNTTNPVSLQPVATLFGQQNSLLTPVSFSPTGN